MKVDQIVTAMTGPLISFRMDDFGKVNLYTYPCNGTKAEKRVYHGHSSHVTNLTFVNNTRLITTGGSDMAIFQWAVGNE